MRAATPMLLRLGDHDSGVEYLFLIFILDPNPIDLGPVGTETRTARRELQVDQVT
jgi:hypothetical protein